MEETKSKTLIIVEGGSIQSITSTDSNMIFTIRDYDNVIGTAEYEEYIECWPQTQWNNDNEY